MGSVVADITMSLDGYVTAPNDDVDRRLGVGGACLHDWVRGGDRADDGTPPSPTENDRQVLDEIFASPGAILMGRRMFDINEGFWDDPWGVPYFVLTHRPGEKPVKGPTTFTFVTDGLGSALEQAKAAAGDKPVGLMGGANVIQQYLRAGLVDELQIHVAHVLLGAGIRLFDHLGAGWIDLEVTRVIESPFATHLKFRIGKLGATADPTP
jgi:dihydrofolate reductase